ncbi:23S rRNA (uracil(747)-C(5))-methyltransferase RlmC [Orbus sasakiae]|uniref:23S rRNA (uracil(747)-C(5))-methyltransferase RlmC n=1 Tax=Orbus sasakiae TaxID=1078475 RepID=A0ABP9N2K5_9GAMM
MICRYYEQQKCLSCQWITKPYAEQIDEKQQTLSSQLSALKPKSILSPMTSPTVAFRNKAKMAVLGTVERPVLGIMTNGEAVDLCDCPLYSDNMRFTLYKIRKLIKKLQLVPYNIRRKKGEIKFVILTEAQDQFMLRFVLRSDKDRPKITAALSDIQASIPQITVISINIQPQHAAILEGEQEYVLTKQQQFPIELNHIPLFIEKGSFFQTNTFVAGQLYLTAKQWLATLSINLIWDLFCGVGGFGLHCITPSRQLIGIEINSEAIECAKQSAAKIGYDKIRFQSLDASQFTHLHVDDHPDLILVNPPRRGLGLTLVNDLQHISPQFILYSSCNLETLVSDLHYLTDYQVNYAQLFDMFPHTPHMEVLVLLEKLNDKRSIL